MPLVLNSKQRFSFQKIVLQWFSKNHRYYPWRKQSNPYMILVAEVLLQKTNAEKVTVIYSKFINKYPDIRTLAGSHLEDIETKLMPLGLKYKASRLKNISDKIISEYNFEIPSSLQELTALPGIGQYIANAILCFGYGKKVPILDVNVIRLYKRAFGITSEKKRPREDPALWNFATKMLPNANFKEYNMALLDLGSLICQSKITNCNNCPASSICISCSI